MLVHSEMFVIPRLHLRQSWRRHCLSRYSTRSLSLAYNVHKPHNPETGHAPLIILHGLFGSKQNNRSISKYGFSRPPFRFVIEFEKGTCKRPPNASLCTRQFLRQRRRSQVSLKTLQDLRNHGDSPHHPVHDYPAMAEDVEEFIEQHDLRLPTLIGHSMSVFVLFIGSWTKLKA